MQQCWSAGVEGEPRDVGTVPGRLTPTLLLRRIWSPANALGQRLAKARESGMSITNPTIATTITMTTTRESLKL